MARVVKCTPTVVVSARIINYKADKTVEFVDVTPDDTVTDFKYAEDGEVKKISGRVAKVEYSGWKNAVIADKLSSKGSFVENAVITGFIIDKSTQNHSDIVRIPAEDVLEAVEGDVTSISIVGSMAVTLNVKLSDETESEVTISEGDKIKDATIIINGVPVTGTFQVVEFLYLTQRDGEADVRGMILRDATDTKYMVKFTDVLNTGTLDEGDDDVDDGKLNAGGEPMEDGGDND